MCLRSETDLGQLHQHGYLASRLWNRNTSTWSCKPSRAESSSLSRDGSPPSAKPFASGRTSARSRVHANARGACPASLTIACTAETPGRTTAPWAAMQRQVQNIRKQAQEIWKQSLACVMQHHLHSQSPMPRRTARKPTAHVAWPARRKQALSDTLLGQTPRAAALTPTRSDVLKQTMRTSLSLHGMPTTGSTLVDE